MGLRPQPCHLQASFYYTFYSNSGCEFYLLEANMTFNENLANAIFKFCVDCSDIYFDYDRIDLENIADEWISQRFEEQKCEICHFLDKTTCGYISHLYQRGSDLHAVKAAVKKGLISNDQVSEFFSLLFYAVIYGIKQVVDLHGHLEILNCIDNCSLIMAMLDDGRFADVNYIELLLQDEDYDLLEIHGYYNASHPIQ